MIDAIAASLAERGFDPAHAIIARPIGEKYQIVSGHHRVAAARQAGLVEVPAWVREMTDDAAYMALVTSNAQSELSALERGLHALHATEKGSKLGRSVAAYAKEIGRARQSVDLEVAAADVFEAVATHVASASDLGARHLAEIHAAPRWLWSALVEKLQAEGLPARAGIEIKAVLS